MIDLVPEFRKNLTALLKEKRVTLKFVSNELGIPYSTIYSWTLGSVPKNPQFLKKLAHYFNVELYFLLFGISDPNSSNERTFLEGSFHINRSAHFSLEDIPKLEIIFKKQFNGYE